MQDKSRLLTYGDTAAEFKRLQSENARLRAVIRRARKHIDGSAPVCKDRVWKARKALKPDAYDSAVYQYRIARQIRKYKAEYGTNDTDGTD